MYGFRLSDGDSRKEPNRSSGTDEERRGEMSSMNMLKIVVLFFYSLLFYFPLFLCLIFVGGGGSVLCLLRRPHLLYSISTSTQALFVFPPSRDWASKKMSPLALLPTKRHSTVTESNPPSHHFKKKKRGFEKGKRGINEKELQKKKKKWKQAKSKEKFWLTDSFANMRHTSNTAPSFFILCVCVRAYRDRTFVGLGPSNLPVFYPSQIKE